MVRAGNLPRLLAPPPSTSTSLKAKGQGHASATRENSLQNAKGLLDTIAVTLFYLTSNDHPQTVLSRERPEINSCYSDTIAVRR